MTEQKPSTMRSLERSIDVLEVLEDVGRPLRLAEIADRAGLHIATAQRILSVLEARHRVERDAAGYRAGVNLIFGAHAYLMTSPLVAAARPVLQELADRTGLTASLFVRSGWHRAVVARVSGARPMHYELPIGSRLPLHLGAGKTLAAAMSPDELSEYLAATAPLHDSNGGTIDSARLVADLDRIRSQGFQVATGERQVGTISVSAPIRRQEDRTVVGALTIGAIAELVPEKERDNLTLEVRRAAASVRIP